MPDGLPVVCAVAEVRERKRPFGQGGRGARAGSCAARIAASGKMKPRRRPTPRRPPPWTSYRRCRFGHAERQTVSIKRSYNAIRFNTHRYGADVNYLVAAF